MKQPWFKSKTHGWGWYPSSWQGWAVLLIYSVIFTYLLTKFEVDSLETPLATGLTWFFGKIIVLTILLIWICYKTGERPGWRWGNKK